MLNNKTTIHAASLNNYSATSAQSQFEIWESLRLHGHVLLRNFEPNMSKFSELIHHMCNTVTFDPARTNASASVQKVDAGCAALGLHIENGNTPNVPELIFFYCRKAPKAGSRTTLCDGVKLLSALPKSVKQLLSQPLYVSRTISETHWRTYLANEHPELEHADQATPIHLQQMLSLQSNIEGQLNSDNSLSYRLQINPILKSHLCNQEAFANAILGPSFSYEPPVFQFQDGSVIDEELKAEIAVIAERFTLEIPWIDGDIAIIDNNRVMHGRREIIDTENRQLFIGMGNPQ